MRLTVLICVSVSAQCAFPGRADDKVRQQNDRIQFEESIQPIFRNRCYDCHGRDVQEAGLRLDNRQAAFAGGESGKAIVPGKAAESLLWKLVTGKDERGRRMPPKGEGKPLTNQEVKLLTAWIAQGAVWPEGADRLPERERLWSFRPVERPGIPRNATRHTVRNPIDAFHLVRLHSANLELADSAMARQLIRRAYFDLLGVPPTPAEVERFLADRDEAAWENLIDRLLADPRYGERWGRHWLDLARYADSNGYEVDGPKPMAWKYRDYVIAALNADKPYDRFIVEQLAGDELRNATPNTLIATGFYRVGPWDAERGASVQKNEMIDERFNELDDIVSTTSQVFLGLTMGCARCHDHKFDPLSIRDYYSMVAIFDPLTRPRKGRTELTDTAVPYRLRSESESGMKKPSGSSPQGYFFVEPPPTGAATHLLKRGNPRQPGIVVHPAVPVAVTEIQPKFEMPDQYTTRRRISLARWVADPANPLTSRVMVNRVWQHHFGRGIVRSPSDFGRRGSPPTHPRLLDWLAHWFVRDARFSIKRLHRLIMTSNAYRMSQSATSEQQHRDPDNRRLSHFPSRRLEAEAIRDAMLAVSGQLRRTLHGPPMYPEIPAAALRSGYDPSAVWKPYRENEASRRTIYAYVKRTLVVPFLETLDVCDSNRSAAQRDVTTVAPQALELLNGRFANRQAAHLADRLLQDAGGDLNAQIQLAYRLALSRPPSDREQAALRAFVVREQTHLLEADQRRREPAPKESLPRRELALWLDASQGVERNDAGEVAVWRDQSGRGHHGSAKGSPRWQAARLGGKPTIVFDGKGDWFSLAGSVLNSQRFSIFAVVSDRGKPAGHRNLFGNWNGGQGNSGTSVFLGTSQAEHDRHVRVTDNYADPRLRLMKPERGFLLTAIAETDGAVVFQDGEILGNKGSALSKRRLDTAWMVGRQGTAGEYWHGDIAELIVYNRAVTPDERRDVWSYLGNKYGLSSRLSPPPLTRSEARRRALALMCRVIFNLNEFVYPD